MCEYPCANWLEGFQWNQRTLSFSSKILASVGWGTVRITENNWDIEGIGKKSIRKREEPLSLLVYCFVSVCSFKSQGAFQIPSKYEWIGHFIRGIFFQKETSLETILSGRATTTWIMGVREIRNKVKRPGAELQIKPIVYILRNKLSRRQENAVSCRPALCLGWSIQSRSKADTEIHIMIWEKIAMSAATIAFFTEAKRYPGNTESWQRNSFVPRLLESLSI